MRSIELQTLVTDTRQDTELLITVLNTAPEEYPLDYDKLQAHVCAAVRMLERHREKLAEVENALGNDFPLDESEAAYVDC